MIQYNQRKIKLFNFFLAIVLMLRVVAIGSIHKSPHSVSVKTVVCHTSRVNTFRLHCLQYIMEDIFWSGTPYLESVGEHEPAVEELRETIRHAITRSLIPLKDYAIQFDKYLELINLDIGQYIK